MKIKYLVLIAAYLVLTYFALPIDFKSDYIDLKMLISSVWIVCTVVPTFIFLGFALIEDDKGFLNKEISFFSKTTERPTKD